MSGAWEPPKKYFVLAAMLMGWKGFIAANPRPFIVYADLADQVGVRGTGGRQNKFALLGTLLKALALRGDYALLPETETIRIAFSREEAARAFADTIGASKTAREGGWAGQWSFSYDNAVMEKIAAVLPPKVSRAARGTVKKRVLL